MRRSSSRRAPSTAAPQPPARPRRAAEAPLAPPPPLARDPWAWVAVLGVIPLLVRAWGAPLGEPVAEDFDFLHYTLFQRFSLFDGGGSRAFWRPLAHQGYYAVLGRLMLASPLALAMIHAACFAVASLLLYRAFRRVRPGAWAAVVATTPLLSESTRTIITWPSHFVDLGVWLFVAIAVHETAARRLRTTCVALGLAFLCKEVAMIPALLLPWFPGIRVERAERRRWVLALGGVAAGWAVAYVTVRELANLKLPHNLEGTAAHAAWSERFAWALTNSGRALVSLPAVAVNYEGWLLLAAGAVLLGAVPVALARGGLRRMLPMVAWGSAWFLAASAALVFVFPYWAPARTTFASLGFGVAAAEVTWAAHPAVLAAFVAVRLVGLALAPGAPRTVTLTPAKTGAFTDFQRITRLQLFMRDIRRRLKVRIPAPIHGMRVGAHYMPREAQYAFGGSNAIQAWYLDPSVRWIPFDGVKNHPDSALVTIVEYEPPDSLQISLVNPDAMRALFAGRNLEAMAQWEGALAQFARADSLTDDPNSHVFMGLVGGERSRAYIGLLRFDEAEREARRASLLWHENVPAHYTLACVAFLHHDLLTAAGELDSTLTWNPTDPAALKLKEALLKTLKEERR